MNLLLTVLTLSWLSISSGGQYIQTEDGQPFFWMGDTGWLMPEKLTREDVDMYLDNCRDAGFNVVQMQVTNAVPSVNIYGQRSGSQEYWYHMDYILNKAADNGIYVAMNCIWGLAVSSGEMDVELAEAYGQFLATRYKDRPNVIWVLGGNVSGDFRPDIWEAMAQSIKSIDSRHLMTFLPSEGHSSSEWWNDSSWLDFNMFNSGPRRYDQRIGDAEDYGADKAEDNWRYVDAALKGKPLRPVLDAEPAYEGTPQGFFDEKEPRWQAADCRRYAYWSVFEGACGHTYGNNAIMQFYNIGDEVAFAPERPWKESLDDPGRNQMKYLKRLMDTFSSSDRRQAQELIIGNGERYERIAATRGTDFLLAYSYSNRQIRVELGSISGARKQAWWYSPVDGTMEYIGEFKDVVKTFTYPGDIGPGNDHVLIITDWKSSNMVKPLEKEGKPSKLFKK